MKQNIRKMLRNTTLGTKMITGFVSVIIIPMLLLSYTSYWVISRQIIQEANEKIEINIRRALKEYDRRGREMGLGMAQAAAGEVIRGMIQQRDREWAKRTLRRFEEARTYVDFWIITDREGRVISRLNTNVHGDLLEINGLVSKAISSGKQSVSSEILNEDFLKKEGFNDGYSVAANAGISSGEYKRTLNLSVENRALAVVVVTPVFDEGRNIIGSIITGDILNRDDFLANEMADVRRGLMTTISLDGLRIATNMIGRDDKTALGTMLPASVMTVIKSGAHIISGNEMLGIKYISAFGPIKDNKGDIIGSVDTGIPESNVLFVQKAFRNIVGLATLIGLVIALGAAFVLTQRITRPVRLMKENAEAFAQGNPDAKIDITTTEKTRDEISILARTFNLMLDRVKDRERERELALTEMNKKNRELGDLTAKLTGAKEEIEVAFEELQSQSEEIQSTNEELRLLNEDMERKNQELIEANRTIRKDEEEIKNARDKLRLIYDTVKDYVLLTDKGLVVLEANHSFTESLGTKESYVIGKILCHLFDIKEPADCPARSLTISDDIADPDANCMDPSSNCPVKRSLRSGSPVSLEMNVGSRILEWHSYPLSEETLFPETAVVYIRDITDQRMLMQSLIQSDKLSSIGELVSGVAHELNNPLTSIMGFSELLLTDNINEGSKKKAETIHESSQRCKRIVDNLLSFSRSHKPEKTYQDINSLIAGILDLKAYRLDVEDIETRLDLEETIPMIMADGHQLQQVFLNLLNNAEHALQEKGGQGTITIRTGYRNNKLFITFTDSGSGIPERIIPRIFDPFFTTKEVGKGTGLGLSISYGIIKEHGGDIQVVSKQGAGTSFLIELPVATSADKPVMTISAHVREEAQIVAGGLRALLLDDEPLILDFVKEVLLDSGYSVDAVSEGKKALEMLGNSDYDIIISDMKMPGMNGKQFYLEAKKLRPKTSGRIIFMSGDTASRETQDFLRDTGNQYIQKPFTVQMLREVISKVLR